MRIPFTIYVPGVTSPNHHFRFIDPLTVNRDSAQVQPFSLLSLQDQMQYGRRYLELRSCVKVEVAVLGSPSLTVLMVSVDVKQH